MVVKYSQNLFSYPYASVSLPRTWVLFGSFVEASVKGPVGAAFISSNGGHRVCAVSLETQNEHDLC